MALHSLAEVFSALTNLPVEPRTTPADARRIIRTNIRARFTLIEPVEHHYSAAIAACEKHSLRGGVIYDALLIECARAARCGRIYTFNTRDFLRIAPELSGRIVSP